jgi:hypothetical protein
MPGTTPLGLRYPFQGETVDATSWQNLATDIDGLMTTTQGLRTKAFHPQTASIGNSGGNVLPVTTASGGSALMLFNVVNWDNASLVNLVANNDRITVGPGIWWARTTVSSLDSWTTLTYMRAGIIDATGSTWAFAQVDTVSTPAIAGAVTTNALIVNRSPTLAIQMLVSWVGTGGPARWAQGTANLQVYRVREIGDV